MRFVFLARGLFPALRRLGKRSASTVPRILDMGIPDLQKVLGGAIRADLRVTVAGRAIGVDASMFLHHDGCRRPDIHR